VGAKARPFGLEQTNFEFILIAKYDAPIRTCFSLDAGCQYLRVCGDARNAATVDFATKSRSEVGRVVVLGYNKPSDKVGANQAICPGCALSNFVDYMRWSEHECLLAA
jgi:hypothetical protein